MGGHGGGKRPAMMHYLISALRATLANSHISYRPLRGDDAQVYGPVRNRLYSAGSESQVCDVRHKQPIVRKEGDLANLILGHRNNTMNSCFNLHSSLSFGSSVSLLVLEQKNFKSN